MDVWNEVAPFQCRTRLCWWCKFIKFSSVCFKFSFNAARGFVGGARLSSMPKGRRFKVSMPHAALLVVQG